jgi:hypothetical protein
MTPKDILKYIRDICVGVLFRAISKNIWVGWGLVINIYVGG